MTRLYFLWKSGWAAAEKGVYCRRFFRGVCKIQRNGHVFLWSRRGLGFRENVKSFLNLFSFSNGTLEKVKFFLKLQLNLFSFGGPALLFLN